MDQWEATALSRISIAVAILSDHHCIRCTAHGPPLTHPIRAGVASIHRAFPTLHSPPSNDSITAELSGLGARPLIVIAPRQPNPRVVRATAGCCCGLGVWSARLPVAVGRCRLRGPVGLATLSLGRDGRVKGGTAQRWGGRGVVRQPQRVTIACIIVATLSTG